MKSSLLWNSALVQEIGGVEAVWVLELCGVPVCGHKQRNQEGALRGHARVTYKLGKTAFHLSKTPFRSQGEGGPYFLFPGSYFLYFLCMLMPTNVG